LPNGGKILTVNPIDFEKSMAKLTNVAANAEIISTELAAITVQIRQGKGSMGRLLYNDDLAKGLEGTINNAENMTRSLADITAEVKSGRGSLGRLLYNDTLAKSLEGTAENARLTMGTINEAAYGFSENMKALQGNFLFRGYFRRKEREKDKLAANVSASDSTDIEFNEDDLKEIEAAAEKAQQSIIDRKMKERAKQLPAPVKGN